MRSQDENVKLFESSCIQSERVYGGLQKLTAVTLADSDQGQIQPNA